MTIYVHCTIDVTLQALLLPSVKFFTKFSDQYTFVPTLYIRYSHKTY